MHLLFYFVLTWLSHSRDDQECESGVGPALLCFCGCLCLDLFAYNGLNSCNFPRNFLPTFITRVKKKKKRVAKALKLWLELENNQRDKRLTPEICFILKSSIILPFDPKEISSHWPDFYICKIRITLAMRLS